MKLVSWALVYGFYLIGVLAVGSVMWDALCR